KCAIVGALDVFDLSNCLFRGFVASGLLDSPHGRPYKHWPRLEESSPRSLEGGDPSMRDVFDKCSAFKDDKIAKATGLYPYFKPIEASHGSTEVDIEGRRVIMVGSNNYLALAGDARVKEAATEAVRRFGSPCSDSRLLNG